MFETWKFMIDPEARGLTAGWWRGGLPEEAKEVRLPHTVNVEEGLEEYRGPMWYACAFTAEPEWLNKDVLLHFGGVYRDTEIWLNGQEVGSHYDSGFSPFTIEIGQAIREGENQLILRVDNSFSMRALPVDRSFDWADDGGLIRGVQLEVVEKGGVRDIQVSVCPKIETYGERQDFADTCITVKANAEADVFVYDGLELKAQGRTGQPFEVPGMELWHFDHPKLYRLVVRKGDSQKEVMIGAREFKTDGARFVLNGEYVRLCGVEWMPGSNPAYGNAEPVIYLKKILKQLKGSGCVFTRFHWQQDDAIYEWCDRHGMLVQEEIPNWGGSPGMNEHLLEVSRKQAEEMVAAHGHHPSIVSWGVGNEMRGQEENSKQFIQKVKEIFKELDPDRLVNYVSNSWWRDPANDAVASSDSLWINEYFGTWVQGRDVDQDLSALIRAVPDKPIVISEFGVCEPAFPGGDKARTENLEHKMEVYRKYPQIGGTIHFSLNDYRTQMGEEGEGKYRRRVHGSTDICGKEKPSYEVLRRESSPLVVKEEGETLTLAARKDLPCYTVKGYYVQTEAGRIQVPTLKPGEETNIRFQGGSYMVYRENGDRVL